MSTLTLRLPEDLASRLKNVAKARGVSMNKLITEIGVQALAVYDTETRFKTMAAEANIPAALAVLDRLEGRIDERIDEHIDEHIDESLDGSYG